MLELMKGESWSWDLNPGSCPPEPASYPLASRACPTVGLSQCFLTGTKEQLASTGHTGEVVSVEGRVTCGASSTALLFRCQAREWF